eukprot:CAMPEP_0119055312 /NCGR_PEP_ID=MMETSP1177-20130426/75640_1 /TAXON_ID=2985 /ORGANISM="Ochromonas sp, Strain CCMP1899" /LENGTH=306 /DNA_ID=CAMNT_0007035815 /DNA_START=1341 /DNA_END=2258 /DNA_ORIENTATION=+
MTKEKSDRSLNGNSGLNNTLKSKRILPGLKTQVSQRGSRPASGVSKSATPREGDKRSIRIPKSTSSGDEGPNPRTLTLTEERKSIRNGKEDSNSYGREERKSVGRNSHGRDERKSVERIGGGREDRKSVERVSARTTLPSMPEAPIPGIKPQLPHSPKGSRNNSTAIPPKKQVPSLESEEPKRSSVLMSQLRRGLSFSKLWSSDVLTGSRDAIESALASIRRPSLLNSTNSPASRSPSLITPNKISLGNIAEGGDVDDTEAAFVGDPQAALNSPSAKATLELNSFSSDPKTTPGLNTSNKGTLKLN